MEKDDLIMNLLKHIEDNGLLQTAKEYLFDTMDEEIDQIKKISQSNLRHKVKSKVKVKSLKQKKTSEPEISELGNKKNLEEKIKGNQNQKVPKHRIKEGLNKFNLGTNSNKYNIFGTMDATESDERDGNKAINYIENAVQLYK
jgi:hypothetical protein